MYFYYLYFKWIIWNILAKLTKLILNRDLNDIYDYLKKRNRNILKFFFWMFLIVLINSIIFILIFKKINIFNKNIEKLKILNKSNIKDNLISIIIFNNKFEKSEKSKNKFDNIIFNKISNGFGNKINLKKNKNYNFKFDINFFKLNYSIKNIKYSFFIYNNNNKILILKEDISNIKIYKKKPNFFSFDYFFGKSNLKNYKVITNNIKINHDLNPKFGILKINNKKNSNNNIKNISLNYKIKNKKSYFDYNKINILLLILYLIWNCFTIFIYLIIYFRKEILSSYKILFELSDDQKKIIQNLLDKKNK